MQCTELGGEGARRALDAADAAHAPHPERRDVAVSVDPLLEGLAAGGGVVLDGEGDALDVGGGGDELDGAEDGLDPEVGVVHGASELDDHEDDGDDDAEAGEQRVDRDDEVGCLAGGNEAGDEDAAPPRDVKHLADVVPRGVQRLRAEGVHGPLGEELEEAAHQADLVDLGPGVEAHEPEDLDGAEVEAGVDGAIHEALDDAREDGPHGVGVDDEEDEARGADGEHADPHAQHAPVEVLEVLDGLGIVPQILRHLPPVDGKRGGPAALRERPPPPLAARLRRVATPLGRSSAQPAHTLRRGARGGGGGAALHVHVPGEVRVEPRDDARGALEGAGAEVLDARAVEPEDGGGGGGPPASSASSSSIILEERRPLASHASRRRSPSASRKFMGRTLMSASGRPTHAA
mmetsp:Transcript_27156/g.68428  ORF Transcript_27156/g.68428 Transcript_27156/m.68428 type:complete len:405 (+) Transcript_27156:728-1942(+)